MILQAASLLFLLCAGSAGSQVAELRAGAWPQDGDVQLRDRGLALLHARSLDEALASFEGYEASCQCAEGAFLTGRALLELERPQSAAAAFQRTLQQEPGHDAARLHLARAWERLGLHAKADSLLRTASSTAARGDAIPIGQVVAGMGPDAPRVKPKVLPGRVNSPSDDFLPWQSLDGEQLLFTSNRPGGLDPTGRAGLFREDLWQSRRLPDGSWESARLLERLNTQASEGGASQSADGRLLVFGACDRPLAPAGCDLLLSQWLGESWSPPQSIELVNSSWWESQPALSAEGRWLIFASNRPGGLGGRDLWLSQMDSLGSFGQPVNLGAPVNSPGEEAGPFLHADGRSLYFSSDGHEGLGGLDLFLSRLGEDGRWSAPVNLGSPFSTKDPDLGLCLDASGRRALFSSRREGQDLDLFEAILPECCPAEARRLLRGRVVEEGSGRPLSARVRLEPLLGPQPEWCSQEADALGRFTLVAPEGDGLLFADHPGHLYACRWIQGSQHDSLLVELTPLGPGKRMVLESIHFAFNEAKLPDHAHRVLEPLRRLLDQHGELIAELRGHTDDVGSARHNRELSLRRAQAVGAWLVAHGVQKEQITCMGAGASEPLIPGENEAARASNRRTELWLRQR